MTLLQALKTIPDNRGKHGRMYDLAHIEGDDKQSEINKFRELVTGLNKDLGTGKLLVTADAIHSQKKL